MSLAERLKEARIKSKMSLQELADEVGASKAHVWELETGRARNPSIELLQTMAKVLNVSVSYFVGENPSGKDDPPDVIRMYRDLKDLNEADRELLQTMIDRFKKRKE